MVNIIYPKHTAKELNTLRDNAIREVGEDRHCRIRAWSQGLNLLQGLVFCSALIFSWVRMWHTVVAVAEENASLVSLFLWLLITCICLSLGLWGLLSYEYKQPNIIFLPFLKRIKWTGPCEDYFLTFIKELEKIESFCSVFEKYPGAALQEIEERGVGFTYKENGFLKEKRFIPQSLYSSESLVKGDGLDFSYIDTRIDEYLWYDKKAALKQMGL